MSYKDCSMMDYFTHKLCDETLVMSEDENELVIPRGHSHQHVDAEEIIDAARRAQVVTSKKYYA